MVAGWLHWTDQADEVWLVPSFDHPFGKQTRQFADRMRWCEALAATVGPWVKVSDIEAHLDGPGFTIVMLRALSHKHPEHVFRYVLGSDNLDALHKWKDWDRIAAEYAPIVVGREGYPNPADAVVFPAVSSTEIRRRLAAGEPADHLVPAAVLALLGESYRSGPMPTTP
jgi:nicotinate-nucleotide adenylyltransferase